jgi:hypothetical protein
MTKSAGTARIARILSEDEVQGLDVLGTYKAAEVRGRDLKPGMVLLDDLDTPAAAIDHRAGRADRRSGTIPFLIQDFETGGWKTHNVTPTQRYRVVAR